jgi:hypothetical protein
MTLPRKLAPPPRWLTVGSTLALLLILCGAILTRMVKILKAFESVEPAMMDRLHEDQ